MTVPIVSFVGKSAAGKTTALEKIIREFKRRGYRVGTVKHDTHGFEVDRPGKDSWRHAQAGSDTVVLSGPHKLAIIRRLEAELSLDEVARYLDDVDIVLTEGYKRGDKPKVEISRRERGTELLCSVDELVAIMADYPVAMEVPQFGLDDAPQVVDLLIRTFLASPEGGER
jgi:molybdopterin-guanine dinucleotide biosynthesis protein B